MNLQRLSHLLWALTLVALPVTSFKYMPFMGSGTFVRPLALYPLVLLLAVLALRQLRGEKIFRWPGMLTILVIFGLATALATIFGAVLAPIPLRGVEYWDRAIRAIITLAIGILFFIAALWMNHNENDLKFSLRWLFVGLAGHILWGTIQYIGMLADQREIITNIQELFSVRGVVQNRRASGFAFEPSWLASQLVALYMPWLLAGILTGFTILPEIKLKNRSWQIGVLVLLAGAIALMFMTYSRSGLVALLVISFLTGLLTGRQTVQNTWMWFLSGFHRQPASKSLAYLKALITRMAMVILLLGVLLGAGAYLGSREYISNFWTTDMTDFWKYMTKTSVSPRLSYWIGALAGFDENPLTGVGLGASGFRIYQNLPDGVLMGVPEIAIYLSPDSSVFPNPKNLYFRLLSETGLVGFSLFMAFWLALLADAVSQLQSQKQALRFLGVAGMITIGGMFLQGVSLDSFALPEFWINIGILAGIVGAGGKGS